MIIKTQVPITMLYRGDIRDTATLIRLVLSRVNIGLIAYIGVLDKEKEEYLRVVNNWLKEKGHSPIMVHPVLSKEQLDRTLCPIQEWDWSLDECKVMIRLSSLPLPKSQ